MAETRAIVYLFLLLVTVQRTLSSPNSDSFWCSEFCSDGDESDDDEDSYGWSDLFLSFLDPILCAGCEDEPSASKPSKPAASTPTGGTGDESEADPDMKPQKINLSIPPANGVNLTLQNSGTWWWLNFVPWPSSGGTSTPTAAPATDTAATPATNATAGNATTA